MKLEKAWGFWQQGRRCMTTDGVHELGQGPGRVCLPALSWSEEGRGEGQERSTQGPDNITIAWGTPELSTVSNVWLTKLS